MKEIQPSLLLVLLVIFILIQVSHVNAYSSSIHQQQNHLLKVLAADTLNKNDLGSDKKNCRSEEVYNFRKHMQPDSSSAKNKNLPPVSKLAITLCPVCKMELEGILVDTTYYNNKMYGFCSGHCKIKFKSNPQMFVR